MKKNYLIWLSAMLMMAIGLSGCSSDDSDDGNNDSLSTVLEMGRSLEGYAKALENHQSGNRSFDDGCVQR